MSFGGGGFGIRVIGRSTDDVGGETGLAAIDLGNGMAALLTVTATRTITSPTPAATSQSLLAANTAGNRIGAIIRNEANTNLHVIESVQTGQGAGRPAETVVPPLGYYDTSEAYQGAVSGWWEGSPTGTCTVIELT